MDNTPQVPPTPSDNSASTDTPVNPVVRRPITTPTSLSGSMDGVVRRSGVTLPQSDSTDTPKTLEELDAPVPTIPEVSAPVTPAPPIVSNEPQVAVPAAMSGAPELPGQPTPPVDAVASSPTPPQPSVDVPPAPVAPATPVSTLPLEEVATQEIPKAEGSVVIPPVTSAPKGRKGTGVAILIGVLFTVALIGGAGYAYWQNNKNKTPAVQTEQKTEEKKTVEPATADAIQKASDDIDAALGKVDDAKDFIESDLSDATLGL